VGLRLPIELIFLVEEWGAQNQAKSRSDAIRRLVELGLGRTRPIGRTSPKEAAHARVLAGEQIDRLADQAASSQEQQRRKRRLLSGPTEFRALRKDHAAKARN
jgi:hypothetical protein